MKYEDLFVKSCLTQKDITKRKANIVPSTQDSATLSHPVQSIITEYEI